MTALAPHKAGLSEWRGLAVLALPTLLLGLDVTVLYLVVPELATELRPSSTEALWVMDAYGFLIAGFLITMGTLGDRIGRRRLLMIGAAAFGLVSVLAAYSTNAEMLIAARALLGVAGATLMPSTLALITNMFSDARQRAVAIGVWATMFALGMAAGPILGGVLLDRFWWGSAFLIAVPMVVVLLLAAPRVLPEYRDPHADPIDIVSVVLSLAAILPIVYAIKHAADAGFDPTTALAVALGAAFGTVFVRRQRQMPNPLLDMTLFANGAFSAALGMLLVGLVGVGGVMMLVTQYLQLVEGLSPLVAGAWLAPPALMMFLAAIGAPFAARRVRPGFVAASTLAVSTVGYLVLSQVEASDGVVPVVIGFAFVYLGLGAIAALGTDLVVSAAPMSKAGSASAMSETVQELGLAVGVATLGSLATGIYRAEVRDEVPADLPPGVTEATRDSLAGALSVAPQLPSDLLESAKQGFTTGLNLSTLVAGIVVLALAGVSALALRHIGPLGGDGGHRTAHPAHRTAPGTLATTSSPDMEPGSLEQEDHRGRRLPATRAHSGCRR
jgi:DHA2 family multidrug resistance protein-like MFS transporter